MDMSTEPATKRKREKKIVGRQDNEGQEQVIENSVIEERIDELVTLKKSAEEHAESYSSAVKKTAEDSGYNSATVRKYVDARAGENFESIKKKCLQLALIFEIAE